MFWLANLGNQKIETKSWKTLTAKKKSFQVKYVPCLHYYCRSLPTFGVLKKYALTKPHVPVSQRALLRFQSQAIV